MVDIKVVYKDYKNVLSEAQLMGCNEVNALYHIPLDVFKIIVNALERQTPFKVKKETWIDTKCKCGYCFSKSYPDGYYTIPHENMTKYCPECGQCLDWGKDI